MSEVAADATMTLTMEAEDMASSVIDGIEGSLSNLQAVAGAVGIGLTAAFLAGAESLQQYGLQIQGLNVITGQHSEASSALLSAFEGTGIGAQQAGTMIRILSMHIGSMELAQARAAAAGKKSTTALDELHVATKNADGSMRSMNQMMPDIVDGLHNMTNAQERARLGNQLFGRSWASMAPAIDAGGEAFKEAMKNAEKYGLVLTDQDVKAAHEAEVAHMHLTMALEGVSNAFGSIAMPAVTRWTEKIADLIASIHRLNPALLTTVVHGLALAAIFLTLTGGVESVLVVMSKLSEVGGGGGIMGLFDGLLKGVAKLLGPLSMLAGIAFAVYEAYQNLAVVHQLLQPLVAEGIQLWNEIADAFGYFMDNLDRLGLIDDLAAALTRLGVPADLVAFITGVLRFFADAWDRVSAALQWFATHVQADPIAAVVGALKALGVDGPIAAGIGALMKAGWEFVAGIFHDIAGAVTDAIATWKLTHSPILVMTGLLRDMGVPLSVINDFLRGAQQLWADFVSGGEKVKTQLWPALQHLYEVIIPALNGAWATIKPALDKLLLAFQPLIDKLIGPGGVHLSFRDVVGGATAFVNFLTTVLPPAIDATAKAIAGIVSVLADLITNIQKATKFVGDHKDAFEALGLLILVAVMPRLVNLALFEVGEFITSMALGTGAIWKQVAAFAAVQVEAMAFNWKLWIAIGTNAVATLSWLGLGAAITIEGIAAAVAAGTTDLLTGALVLLGGPVGVIVFVLTILVAVFIALYANNETFRNGVNALGDDILRVGGWIRDNFISALTAVGAAADAIMNPLRTISGLFSTLMSASGSVGGAIQMAMNILPHAEGGVFSTPHIGLIAEGGQTEVVSTLSQAMQAGMVVQQRAAGGGGGGGGDQRAARAPVVHVTVINQLDGKEVSRRVFEEGSDRYKLLGGTLGSGA